MAKQQKIVKFKTNLKYGFDFECTSPKLEELLAAGWIIKQIHSQLPIESTSIGDGGASESINEMIIIALLEKEN